jgi:hypothetical protein
MKENPEKDPNNSRDNTPESYSANDKPMTDIWILLCIQILLLIWSVSIISELISKEV